VLGKSVGFEQVRGRVDLLDSTKEGIVCMGGWRWMRGRDGMGDTRVL
jgi:hypothetical protein